MYVFPSVITIYGKTSDWKCVFGQNREIDIRFVEPGPGTYKNLSRSICRLRIVHGKLTKTR